MQKCAVNSGLFIFSISEEIRKQKFFFQKFSPSSIFSKTELKDRNKNMDYFKNISDNLPINRSCLVCKIEKTTRMFAPVKRILDTSYKHCFITHLIHEYIMRLDTS